MNKLEAMQIFIEVAKHQSFVAASRSLEMSAPTITRTIAELESRLGVKLFNRTTRHVRLTQSGLQFLNDVSRILEDIEETEAALSGSYTEPKGVLTITAPVLFGEKYIIPIISEYLEQNTSVSVRTIFHDRVASLIEEELDIAIRIGHLKDSNLYATTVGEIRRIVCASPAYLESFGIPKSPEELSKHKIILPTTYDSSSTWKFHHQDKKISVKLAPRLRCNQNGAALKAAVLGYGVTRLMSYQVAEELEKRTLQCILTDYEDKPIPVNVIHLEGRRANAKIRAFIELAVHRLRANPFINPK